MNSDNYDENNDINVSPIQESDLDEPTLTQQTNETDYNANGYSEKSEEDLLSESIVLTSLNGKKINQQNENIIPPDEYINENYIPPESQEVPFDFDNIDISPEQSVSNAVDKYDNLDNDLNDEIENTITISNLEQKVLKEFIKDLSEDDEIISKDDLNEEIDFLDNPSIDNERLKFFVNQLSDDNSFDYREGLANLSKFSGHKFSVPLSMSLTPDPSSDLVNLKTNEKAKQEKIEREHKSENPSNEENNRRIELDKKIKEIENRPIENKPQQQPQGENIVVKESLLGAGIKMLNNRVRKKENAIEEPSVELSSGDKIDSLNNDIKTLTKNFQSYNLMDDNDPNKQIMKQSIEKRMSEIGDKMDSNPISEEDLESDPQKTKGLEKSTSRLNKSMKNTKNSEMDGLKDFKERMSTFFNKIKKVVAYVISKIKGNNSNFTP